MGLFNNAFGRLLGKPGPARPSKSAAARGGPHSTQFVASQLAPGGPSSAASTHVLRKDLLKLVMRESLTRNGIPEAWLSADLLRTTSPRREPGIHVRLLVKHWEPRLMQHGVALEQDLYQRLLALDPQAADWLMGFSWQFALGDRSRCPPLPHPGSWTAPPEPAAVRRDEPPATKPGDIIEGPVFIPKTQDEVRADLERLLSVRDDDLKRNTPGDGFAATRPIQL